jgi:Bacterial Ig-like domain
MAVRPALIALALAVALGSARAQDYQDPYEYRYGVAVDVSISDLVQNGPSYEGRSVRTHSRVFFDSSQGQRVFFFQDMSASRVYLVPVPEQANTWDFDSMKIIGSDLEVTGLFSAANPATQGVYGAPGGTITFWKFQEQGDEEDLRKTIADATTVTLESLVTHPAKQDGRTVRVAGLFRGRNLFGDLPSSSQRSHSDWVIKDDLFAVWVMGKKPKGDGLDLDPSLKRDSGHWVEVIGKVQARGGIVYIQALRVMAGAPPRPDATAKATPLPERPKVPPVIVFELPIDGETDVPPRSRFVVQFSKDMDESSFKGRVILRYSGRVMPGERDLDGVSMSYDGGRRALTVDPGDLLQSGRQMELLLLPGIVDIDGLALEPRPGRDAGVAVDFLRYRIAG